MHQFQTSNFTSPLRYRATYADLAKVLNFTAEPSVLLFGCSTGIEILNILTIKPHANIVATDIHIPSLKAATKAFGTFTNVHFCTSQWDEIRGMGPFDVIIANSVFCDHPAAMNKQRFDAFDFGVFEFAMEQFIMMMRRRSVLMMCNASYMLQETSVADCLSPLNLEVSGFVPKFDKKGDLAVRTVLRSGFPTFYRRPDFGYIAAAQCLTGTLFGKNVSSLPLPGGAALMTIDVQSLTDAPSHEGGWPILPYTYRAWRSETHLFDYSFVQHPIEADNAQK